MICIIIDTEQIQVLVSNDTSNISLHCDYSESRPQDYVLRLTITQIQNTSISHDIQLSCTNSTYDLSDLEPMKTYNHTTFLPTLAVLDFREVSCDTSMPINATALDY